MNRLSPLIPRLRRGSSRSPSLKSQGPRYEYEDLFHNDYVRVCRILPGSREQRLECELIEVPIHGCPLTYECLSYTWGDCIQTHAIACGGKDIPVTKTLHSVLVLLRRPEEFRDIWIDQISINQGDIAERGRQVQMMADIYRNADHVVIWLGEESKNSDLAFKYVEQLAATVRATSYSSIDEKALQKHGLPGTGSKPWEALGSILQRPWFSRSWVVQEAAVAKSATLHCGSSSIAWADFALVLARLPAGASRHFGASLYHNGSPAERVLLIENWRKWEGRADPFKVFTFSKNCDATDDRDKLFAFTSLASLQIKTDYTRTIDEIYITFAKSYLERALKGTKSTFSPHEGRQTPAKVIAGFLCNAGKLNQKHDLPSWVPDWSVTQNSRPFWTTKRHPSLEITYNAGGDTLGDCEVDHSRGLHISVMMIDSIKNAGTANLTSSRDWTDKQLQQRCAEWFTEASAMAFSWQTPYFNGETRNEALMRTLVADVDAEANQASIQYAHNTFQCFLTYIYERAPIMLFSSFKREHINERYAFGVASTILGRVFFVTQQGFIGLAPFGARAGDEVAVMLGSDIPFLIRRKGEGLGGPEYELLGECYLHGIMFGEVWRLGCPVQRILIK
jgi:Heterokaryon incompatibility protein (HET)